MPRTLQILLALATLSMAFSSGAEDQNFTSRSISTTNIKDETSTITESTTMLPTTLINTIRTTEPTEIPETSTIGITTTIPRKVTHVTPNSTKVQLQPTSKRRNDSLNVVWECPNITGVGIECSCDFPHTLRCTGDRTALQVKNGNLIKDNIKNQQLNNI